MTPDATLPFIINAVDSSKRVALTTSDRSGASMEGAAKSSAFLRKVMDSLVNAESVVYQRCVAAAP